MTQEEWTMSMEKSDEFWGGPVSDDDGSDTNLNTVSLDVSTSSSDFDWDGLWRASASDPDLMSKIIKTVELAYPVSHNQSMHVVGNDLLKIFNVLVNQKSLSHDAALNLFEVSFTNILRREKQASSVHIYTRSAIEKSLDRLKKMLPRDGFFDQLGYGQKSVSLG